MSSALSLLLEPSKDSAIFCRMKEWGLIKQSFGINSVSCTLSYAWSVNLIMIYILLIFCFFTCTASLLSGGYKRHYIWHSNILSHSFWQLSSPIFFSFSKKHSALLLKKLPYHHLYQTSCSLNVHFVLKIFFTRNCLLHLAKGLLSSLARYMPRVNPFWKLPELHTLNLGFLLHILALNILSSPSV